MRRSNYENYLKEIFNNMDSMMSMLLKTMSIDDLEDLGAEGAKILYTSIQMYKDIKETSLEYAREEDKKWNELRSALDRIEHKLDRK